MSRSFPFEIPVTVSVQDQAKLYQLYKDFAEGKDVINEIQQITKEPIKFEVKSFVTEEGSPYQIMQRYTASAREYTREREKAIKNDADSLSNLRGLVRQQTQARDGLLKYNQTQQRINIAGLEFTRITRTITPQWQAANTALEETKRKISDINSITIGGFKVPDFGEKLTPLLSFGNKVTQIVAAVQAVGEVFQFIGAQAEVFIQRAKQIAQLELAFTNFGLSARQAEATVDQAAKTALTYGASLVQVEQAYKRLVPVILASGGSLKTTDDVISSLVARTTALGLNTEQAGRYIEAFAQVMGKGKLQAEELNQQFSELDGALRSQLAAYLEAKFGITDLEEAMKNGQITSGIFRDFMIAAGEAAKSKLAGDMFTAQERVLGLNQSFNPTQIENYTKALDAIRIRAVSEQFDSLGRTLAGLQLSWVQFTTYLSTAFPAAGRLVSTILAAIVLTIQAVGVVIGLLVVVVVGAIDLIANLAEGLINLVRRIPGVNELFSGLVVVFARLGEALFPLRGIFEQTEQSLNQQVSATDKAIEASQALAQQKALEKEAWQKAKAAIDEGIASLEDRYKQLERFVEVERGKIDARYRAEKEQIESTKVAATTKHNEAIRNLDEELRRVNSIYDAVKSRYDLEIEALRARTPAEQALYDLEKNKLAQQIASGKLSGEELLQAQAKYERLVANEQIKGLEVKRDQELKKLAEDKKFLEEEKRIELEKQKDLLAELETKADAAKKNADEQTRALEEGLKAIKESIESAKLTADSLEKGRDAAATGTINQSNWAAQLAISAEQAANLRRDLEAAAAISPGSQNKFAGGPVSGGGKYTVNELGKEAFLSASGRLSTINTPAWGQWRAPSSGTIIPAHLAAQLDIPAGGVNLRGGAGSKSSTLRAMGTSGSVSQAMNQLSRTQQAQATELGRLSRAVDRMLDKDWNIDVNINGNNPLLNKLRRTR
jgi:tape measure domain-containing protein